MLGESQPEIAPAAARKSGARLILRRGDGGALAIGGGPETAVMGILNLTPDSFSDGGRFVRADAALRHAHEMVAAGADLLDVGAESTRPGAAAVSADEEWRRLAEVLPALCAARLAAVLSIDTRHLLVARRAAELGVAVLNLTFPQELPAQAPAAEVAATLGAFDGVVVMHSRGTPATMSGLTAYGSDPCRTVATELRATAAALTGSDDALRERLIFDPGLGFAKEAAGSLALLAAVGHLKEQMGRPLLVGASRKSFLGKLTGLPVTGRLAPSLAAALFAAQKGADIVRVHDVAETRAALSVWQAVATCGGPR